jgi:hypothetical protein
MDYKEIQIENDKKLNSILSIVNNMKIEDALGILKEAKKQIKYAVLNSTLMFDNSIGQKPKEPEKFRKS